MASGAAWANNSVDAEAGAEGTQVAVAVPYDLDFIRKPSGGEHSQNTLKLTPFRGDSRNRTIIVNGVEYGAGTTGIVNDKLYISTNLVAIAGLECGEVLQADDASICAVGARNFWTDGDRLFVESGESKGAVHSGPEPAPELAPSTVAFLNYDTNFVANPNGAVALFGSLQPGLRFKENAFDMQATYFQPVNTDVGASSSSRSQITVNSFAYRREWFEKRLRLIAGRTQSPGRGLMGGQQFDGVSLERFNSDDVGSVPTSGPRPITGFAQGPGVVQYRVGDKVYKQIPVREGKFEIGGELLAEVPRGGRLEFVGLDGVARELSMPTDINAQYSFYRRGDYSFDVQLGRLKSLEGDRPFGSIGGRYGLSREVTVDLGLSSTDKAFALGGTVSMRLPGALGSMSLAGATSRGWSGGGSFASTVDANYFNRIGPLSVDLSHRQYFNGGYRGLGVTANILVNSGITQSTRASVGTTLPFPGNDISARVVAERSVYNDAASDSRNIQVDLSRSFGKLGSGALVGRFGRDQYGKSYSSLMLNWVIPLGGRYGVSLNGNSTKSDGGARDNRYSATFWGSSGGAYGSGTNYQVSIDQDRRIAADGSMRGRLGSLTASFSRNPGENLFGSVGMRGGLVLAGGGLIATRSVSDSLLVVRAKELAGSELFVAPEMEGRTRFNGAGFGVITDLPSYRKVNFSFDQSKLPLGMEISQDQLSGSLRPYRGYVVDVPVKRLQPLRLFPKIPKDAFGRGNALSGSSFAPIELDGSLYFNSWPEPGLPLELTWQSEQGVFSCVIELPPQPEAKADGSVFDLIELRDVECKSTKD